MKKPVKIILITVGVIFVLLIIATVSYIFKFKSETSKMSTLPTQEIVEGIFAINNDYVNFYLVEGNDGYIAIDGGQDKNLYAKLFKKLGVDYQKIKAIFLTHSDADHTGATNYLATAKVYLSKHEEQLIDGTTNRLLMFGNRLNCDYILLEDNQELEIAGLKIKCIHTPGHTPGSMCFLVNDVYLFGGDSMSLINGKVNLFNETFNMDPDTQQKSLQKLAALPEIQYLFTAHYGYTDNYSEAFTDFK